MAKFILFNLFWRRLPEQELSKKAYRTIKENIVVGVGLVHITGIVLVLLKLPGPVEAAAIHLLPDTLVFI
ncbi:MAG TPA: hypothetical protein VFP97_02850, partial [Chitinophagaceae bacterium]|nr:hypothetical protein [Chitinophagaceae bacterium]